MAPWPAITVAGGVVGGLMGIFGVGGSSVAAPVLSLLGVPPLVAVASPLVATIPGATIAVPYVRGGDARPRPPPGPCSVPFPSRSSGHYVSERACKVRAWRCKCLADLTECRA